MPAMLPATLPDVRYRHGVHSVLRGLSLPAGSRFGHARVKVRQFVDAVVADVEASHGRVNSRHLTLIEKAKRNLRVLLLVDAAIRHDKRFRTPAGDLDMANDDLIRLLDLERRSASDLASALERLAVPVELRSPLGFLDQPHTPITAPVAQDADTCDPSVKVVSETLPRASNARMPILANEKRSGA